MSRSVRFSVVLGLLCLTACGRDPGPVEGAGPPKHVFLIVIDTLRADHLGSYGYGRETSPTLDRLAADGVLFENAVSTSSNTLEAVISLFTSTTGLTTRVYQEGIPARYESLQRLFAGDGFNTLAVIANPWLKYHEDFFSAGFRHYKFINDERGEYWGANTTDQVTAKVLEFLEGPFDPNGKNFFYVHYLDPHDAYRSPVDYGFFEGEPPEPPPFVHWYSGEDRIQERVANDPSYSEMATPRPLPPGLLEFFVSAYDNEIRYVDEQLARVVDRLAELGVLDDSLIVVTSDHGEEFLDHGLLKHGFQLYRETVEVPLILYGPDFLRPGREKRVVSAIDIAPTLLAMSGIVVPEHMLGSPLFSDASSEPAVFCTHFVNQDKRGMRDGRFKIIENLHDGTLELYDLELDPGETKDLSGDPPPVWSELSARYERALERHAPRPWEPRREAPEMDEETREQLESLGYVQ